MKHAKRVIDDADCAFEYIADNEDKVLSDAYFHTFNLTLIHRNG
jgi:predicted small metal-binding protein